MKTMNDLPRRWKVLIMVLGDLVCCIVSFVLSLLFRFEFAVFSSELRIHLAYLPVVVGFQIMVFLSFHVYAAMWRYTSILGVLRLCAAVIFAFLASLSFLIYFWGAGFSRSVLAMDALLTVLFTSGLRISVRLYYEFMNRREESTRRLASQGAKKRRILIIGAGNAGELILREMRKAADGGDVPVAILDDNPGKVGRTLHGVPVVGVIDALPEVSEQFRPDEIFICIPSAKGEAMRRIVELCEASGIKYKTLPGVNDLILQDFGLGSLREVSYDDLLGRDPVSLDLDQIKEYLTDKVVLVTGCGGSIGSELCRKIIHFDPRQILLLDNGEFNLFSITSELESFHGVKHCVPLLADLNDISLLERIFSTYKPQIVFHAAAYKHVPMLEINPWEAVYNNVIASKNLIEASIVHSVSAFVLVSTDKAVRPTNVMGASKRVTELLLQALRTPGMRSIAVRFGNVIGSSGSVVPFFLKQIKAGKPVTVTHPEVTRFFMTIGEAAQLIIQAGGMGTGGETFLVKMGQSVRIRDMAADLIRLCGKVPNKDVPIVYTGLRPGEKLYEELITVGENVVSTPHRQIMKLRSDMYLDESVRQTYQSWLLNKIAELVFQASRHDGEGIKRVLHDIVPEYTPQSTISCLLASGQEEQMTVNRNLENR